MVARPQSRSPCRDTTKSGSQEKSFGVRGAFLLSEEVKHGPWVQAVQQGGQGESDEGTVLVGYALKIESNGQIDEVVEMYRVSPEQ